MLHQITLFCLKFRLMSLISVNNLWGWNCQEEFYCGLYEKDEERGTKC
jgi:hypothetical protein